MSLDEKGSNTTQIEGRLWSQTQHFWRPKYPGMSQLTTPSLTRPLFFLFIPSASNISLSLASLRMKTCLMILDANPPWKIYKLLPFEQTFIGSKSANNVGPNECNMFPYSFIYSMLGCYTWEKCKYCSWCGLPTSKRIKIYFVFYSIFNFDFGSM